MWKCCIIKYRGDRDSSIFYEGYAVWTTKSVNMDGDPLWDCTFAHKADCHTKKPNAGFWEREFSHKVKKQVNKW